MNAQPSALLVVGARFRLARAVERFPHFLIAAGAEGTLTCADEHSICLRMDEHVPGAEEWDNEIVWTADDDYDDEGDAAECPSAAAAKHPAACGSSRARRSFSARGRSRQSRSQRSSRTTSF